MLWVSFDVKNARVSHTWQRLSSSVCGMCLLSVREEAPHWVRYLAISFIILAHRLCVKTIIEIHFSIIKIKFDLILFLRQMWTTNYLLHKWYVLMNVSLLWAYMRDCSHHASILLTPFLDVPGFKWRRLKERLPMSSPHQFGCSSGMSFFSVCLLVWSHRCEQPSLHLQYRYRCDVKRMGLNSPLITMMIARDGHIIDIVISCAARRQFVLHDQRAFGYPGTVEVSTSCGLHHESLLLRHFYSQFADFVWFFVPVLLFL